MHRCQQGKKTYSSMSSGKEDEVSTHPRRWGFAAQHLTEQTYGLVVWS